MSNHDALTLCKFRTANFKLPVETGRYESVPYEDRTCRLCTDDTAGSEVHYLFECRSLSVERAHFFAALGLTEVHGFELRYFLDTNNTDALTHLCKFLRTIMSKFN